MSVIGGFVEVAHGKIMIEKNKTGRAENKQKKEGYSELKAQSCSAVLHHLSKYRCHNSDLSIFIFYVSRHGLIEIKNIFCEADLDNRAERIA